MYQQNTDGVDQGNQIRVCDTGFANLSHFKKSGNCDLHLLKTFTTWNLAIDSEDRPRIRVYEKYRNILKWEFYSVTAEDTMTYADEYNSSEIHKVVRYDSFHSPIHIPK